MRRVIFGILALFMLSSVSFAVSDAVKHCVQGCCEGSGGTYDYASNGCTNPGNGSYECSMNCQQTTTRPGLCPSAILLFGMISATIAISRIR